MARSGVSGRAGQKGSPQGKWAATGPWFYEPWHSNPYLYLILLVLVFSVLNFILHAKDGVNLSDEGYLWYGAQAVFRGETPLRDFESYDPGRYYWCALWFHLWRPGILPLRLAEASFKAVGLFFALLAAKRISTNRWELAGVAALLSAWIYPNYKTFDGAVLMAGLYFGLRMLEDPSGWTLRWCGFLGGLSFFMGRNHALYLGLSFSALFWMACGGRPGLGRRILDSAAGTLAGLSPFLFLAAVKPGFLSAWIFTASQNLRRGTNLGLPVPWPWVVWHGWPSGLHGWSDLLFGILFVALPGFCFLGWCSMLWPGKRSVSQEALFKVCVVVGTFYLHYIFSRADHKHLALDMIPFFLGSVAWKSGERVWRRACLVGLLALSVPTIGVESGSLENLFGPAPPGGRGFAFGRDLVHQDLGTARLIVLMANVVRSLGPGERVLIYPMESGFYPALGIQSPIWSVSGIFPASREEQISAIRGIKSQGVRWALIDDRSVDGIPQRRFSVNQPILAEYLREHFRVVRSSDIPPGYSLLHWTGAADDGWDKP